MILPSLADPPRIATSEKVEVYRVSCPYCMVGFAEVPAVRNNDAVQVEGIQEPRRCVTCARFFKLKPRVVLEGVCI